MRHAGVVFLNMKSNPAWKVPLPELARGLPIQPLFLFGIYTISRLILLFLSTPLGLGYPTN
jgi:hypothetical protein